MPTPMSCILQVDGASDLPFPTSPLQYLPTNPALQTTDPSMGQPGQPENLKRAPYNLNRAKQVNKLANDASIKDYVINVSPTEQNVNIVCSTGFYSLVVLPAFSSLFIGYNSTAANVKIHCYDLTGKVDGSNANVNTVIFFKLNPENSSRSNNVTITLHHTVRKVQLQGSSMVNNGTRANVWFLENILLRMFSIVSVSKAVDISKFNALVRDVVVNHEKKPNSQQKCKGCEIPFNGRSQYDHCVVCNSYYHKRCLTTHQCPPPPPPGMCRPSSNLTIGGTSLPVERSPLTAGREIEPSRASPTAATRPPPSDLSPPPLSLGHTGERSTIVPAHNTNTQPRASPASPILDIFLTGSNVVAPMASQLPDNTGVSLQSRGATKNKPKKAAKNNAPATDEIGFELECKRKQLVTAHAKIQELEAENTKVNKTNYILGERIKMFENIKEKDLFEKYFPAKPTMQQNDPNPSHCTTHHCCSPPPCHCHARCQSSHTASDLPATVRELSEKVSKLSDVTTAMKTELAILTRPRTTNPQGERGPAPSNAPLSPEIVVLDSEQFQSTPDVQTSSQQMEHDQSSSSDTNTIDDNVSDQLNSSSHLNSIVLTNQLPQLMHPNIQDY